MMLFLISPTKQMKQSCFLEATKPIYMEYSKKIMKDLQKLDVKEIASLMKVNDAIAQLNFDRFQSFDFKQDGTCALHTYNGLQYLNIQPASFTKEDYVYAQKHIRILSGLYGVLRPLDGIHPYRLEMQSKHKMAHAENLYTLWEDKVSSHLLDCLESEDDVLLNLMSKEYTKVLNESCRARVVDVSFQVEKKGIRKVEATQAKMARGQMIQYVVKNKAMHKSELLNFQALGFRYDPITSTKQELVFVKKG